MNILYLFFLKKKKTCFSVLLSKNGRGNNKNTCGSIGWTIKFSNKYNRINSIIKIVIVIIINSSSNNSIIYKFYYSRFK